MVICDSRGQNNKTVFQRFLLGTFSLYLTWHILTSFYLYQQLPDSPSVIILTHSHLRAAK